MQDTKFTPGNGLPSSLNCEAPECQPDEVADLLYFAKKIAKNYNEPAVVLSNANRLVLVLEAIQVYRANKRAVEKHVEPPQLTPRKRGFFERLFGK